MGPDGSGLRILPKQKGAWKHMRQKHREKELTAQICVVGGGLAGLAAAVSAARHGAKTVLMQDRPVLGGNCSSEIRMWALGCHGKNNQETGIFEEILLKSMYRNPTKTYPIWDSVLYGKAMAEPNLTLLLNCSCNDLEMEDDRIASVVGWQLTTYTWYRVKAEIFIDCSGDSVLAPLSGACFCFGREGRSEYGESIAPEVPDKKTMGMTCMMQARETQRPVSYIPPAWAETVTEEDMRGKDHDICDPRMNYWWMELGGEQDCIRDAENVRDELVALAFGVWDHLKNTEGHGAQNWDLDWMGFLPGKRESNRYVGRYVMTQKDVETGGHFEDLIAYGGWSMDDHNPMGFRYPGYPTIYHPAPAPFGIPYRCLCSANIRNLMFAGRNISVTHSAMSASRVMATCALLGQAAGTAAAMCVKEELAPGELYPERIGALQQQLMEDDCYLPWHSRKADPVMERVHVEAPCENPELLWDGTDRDIGDEPHGCWLEKGSAVTFTLEEPEWISEIRIVFDSDLERESCDGHEILKKYPMLCNRFLNMEPFGFPKTMVRAFEVQYQDDAGNWISATEETQNIQRLVRKPLGVRTRGVRLLLKQTWGAEKVHLFGCEIKGMPALQNGGKRNEGIC